MHLITHIKSKNFMGSNLDEDIAQKTIFTGKNTRGKSKRSILIAINALGFCPFSTKTTKKASDVLNDYGDGKTMTTEFTCGGVIFERKFTRDSKGAVSNKMRVDKKGSTKSEFDIALFQAGAPKIVDLNDFLGMSDAKKIDSLFAIYPPGADLKNLDGDIEKSKKEISRIEESNRTANAVIKRLTESKTDIVMPAGTMAELAVKIGDLTASVLKAQEALKIAEKKNAEELAAKTTQDQADRMMGDNTQAFDGKKDEAVKAENVEYENNVNSNQSFLDPTENIPMSYQESIVVASIRKIITTMEKTNCTMCAGLMVARVELRKFKGGAK